MTWICPYCGTENRKEPVNSRHCVKCKECGNRQTAPEEIEEDRDEQLKQLDIELRKAKWGISPIVDQLSSFRQEVIDLEQEFKEKKQEIAQIQSSIDILKAKPIYREVNRESKVRLDPHQKALPFEEVAACAGRGESHGRSHAGLPYAKTETPFDRSIADIKGLLRKFKCDKIVKDCDDPRRS